MRYRQMDSNETEMNLIKIIQIFELNSALNNSIIITRWNNYTNRRS